MFTKKLKKIELGYSLTFICTLAIWSILYTIKLQDIEPGFINSDYLYLYLIDGTDLLHFRSPPASYLFPDFQFQKISQFFIQDPYKATLYAGYLQLIVVGTLLAMRSGGVAASIALTTCTLLSVEDVLLVSNHFSLSILFFLLLTTKTRGSNYLTIAFAVADPLILIPKSLLIISNELKGNRSTFNSILSIIIGWLIAFIYSETNKQMLFLLPFLSIFIISVYLVRNTKFLNIKTNLNIYQITAIMMLFLAALLIAGGQPMRYTNALISCACLTFFWANSANYSNIKQAAILFTLTFMLVLINNHLLTEKISNFKNKYKCAADLLRERNIATIGVDYWTSKPLSLAANPDLKIIVIDYERWESFPWISPLSWGIGKTRYFMQQLDCPSDDKHCNKAHISKYAESSENVCGTFLLYKTLETINFEGAKDKPTSLLRNINRNFNKFSESK